jgi:hypothetical protein
MVLLHGDTTCFVGAFSFDAFVTLLHMEVCITRTGASGDRAIAGEEQRTSKAA